MLRANNEKEVTSEQVVNLDELPQCRGVFGISRYQFWDYRHENDLSNIFHMRNALVEGESRYLNRERVVLVSIFGTQCT